MMEWTAQDGYRAMEKMRERASCRSFDDREIPRELLDDILKTGLCAASGGNLQPLSILLMTDKEESKELAEICGRQNFIAQAPVNLLFLLDWHKMGIFAKNEKAPFTCDASYMHYLIGLEDVMCAAQMIETAAHLCGLGSCYVGTTNHVGDKLIQRYNMPTGTFPVLMLSIGWPKATPPVRKKLEYDVMVFENKYPDLSDEFVVEKYRNKYGQQSMKLPVAEPYRSDMLSAFKEALLTTYGKSETEEIVAKAGNEGALNETQRRFGLHYHAADMRRMGRDIIEMMEVNGLTPFDRD